MGEGRGENLWLVGQRTVPRAHQRVKQQHSLRFRVLRTHAAKGVSWPWSRPLLGPTHRCSSGDMGACIECAESMLDMAAERRGCGQGVTHSSLLVLDTA